MIEEVTRHSVDHGTSQVRASGTLEQHYAPKERVFLLDVESPDVARVAGAGFLALKKSSLPMAQSDWRRQGAMKSVRGCFMTRSVKATGDTCLQST
jgi:hypothetical protein